MDARQIKELNQIYIYIYLHVSIYLSIYLSVALIPAQTVQYVLRHVIVRLLYLNQYVVTIVSHTSLLVELGALKPWMM